MTVVRDVPVARFGSRHEAEFAAGFLESADIPFRLQFDDAGGAYFGAASVAVLWVRGEDADDAREILEIDGPMDGGPAYVAATRPGLDGASESRGPERAPAVPGRAANRNDVRPVAVLSGSERLVGGALAVGLALSANTLSGVPALLAAAGAVLFGLAALLGSGVAPVRALLRLLAGDA